ncbi:MAG TPA: aminotransferase class I/II-fold pyridoxal phosphate-dependent enzyme, partial [Fuerstia sp.]|nr:aminotransferase class I/II-fold pyridoxal phosphate-dependent enzyme [Fuerstiella sp.]
MAAFDFDCDGAVDMFFPQGGPLPGTKDRASDVDCLLRRTQDVFVDVSSVAIPAVSDYGHGAAVGDLNNDGFPDLFVTNFGLNQLLLNNGDGTFTDATIVSGLSESEWSVSSAFEDFDNDGDFSFKAENVLSKITHATRLIIINSPANPTGGICERQEMQKLAKGLEEYPNIFILSDEIYSRIMYDDYEHVSPIMYENLRDRTILLDGWSKTYAMTGWRLGYGVWPSSLIESATRLAINS